MLTWANLQYKKIGAHLESLDEFADGEPLLVLMELLFLPGSKQTQAKKVAANGGKPTMKGCTAFKKLEMLQRAMMIATDAGVRFRFISAEDFVEKNMKMMLAFCYASALRFNTRGLVEDDEAAVPADQKAKSPKTDGRASEKDALLAWVKERVASYGVPVKDFAGSWLDGRAFLALVHSLCGGIDGTLEPAPFDYRAVAAAGDDKTRAETAFARAEELLGVQPLICYMDVEERNTDAVVMYVSELSRALRERDDLRATPKPAAVEAPDVPGPKKVELSEEEYQRLVSELESTRKKVGELEGELAESRISKTEKVGHRHHKSDSKSKSKDDKDKDKDKDKKGKGKSKSKSKSKEDKVSKTLPAPSTDASPVDSLAQAHSDEHKKVLKLREQLQRAIERVEELAETAAEDPDTVEDLPDELAWLLDTIMQKDQEATSSAALMTQLEMQMTVSGTGGGDALLTEAEKLEVNDLLQNVAEEENHALSQIHDVLAKLIPDVQGKPIEAEVERLRRLALIGAERARRTLSGAEEAAEKQQQAQQRQQRGAGEALARTAVAAASPRASEAGVLERRMSMPACGVGARRREAIAPAADMTAEQRRQLEKDVDETPVDAVSLPAVVERFDSLEQQLEREEPQLTEHVEAMRGTRSKAKEALKQTKTALSKAFHIAKKAERREEAKKKKAARAMAVPADPSDVGKLRAAMIAALDVLLGDVSGDKQRLKERKAFIALQGDEFVARFAALVADVQRQMARDQAEKTELQGQLVDAQTKVWERVKQLRK